MEDRILRLTQTLLGEDRYRVEIALEKKGKARRIATCEFSFKLTPQDQEDIRWYLEDYLQYPLDPAPKIAARIEKRIAQIGTDLFKEIFPTDSEDAREIWFAIRNILNETRVEIISGVQEATAIPWELLCDPKTNAPLALSAHAFVRASHQSAQTPKLPTAKTGPIRILLVICRPKSGDDVPFRSVASRLIRGLDEAARESFQLDVLRPPTFEQLGRVLRQAKVENRAYHIVHFDGHGVYTEEAQSSKLASILRGLSSVVLSGQPGAHGYLLFENPSLDENVQLVGGPALSSLLVETGVPVLVLNACRSAHAEAPEKPKRATQDVHAQVRAYGSLAQEVMDAGVAGVVAMRYSVYVVTAAQFVADLYASLAKGQTLGQAVTLGRKQLSTQPVREIAYDARPLRDWCVPLVYEAAPIGLFPKPAKEERVHIELKPEGRATAVRGELDPKLPPPPDVGFYGRDETLLALDRAFDSQSIVLLHAYAGSGKTATAAEFARWYSLTGGVKGPVLFTSFEQHKPLARVIDQLGQMFGQALEQSGIHWLTLEEEQRRKLAKEILRKVPVLWIWDNVEPVTGFPTGTESAWSTDEQEELADFLRTTRGTKAKFLLTSRRDEQKWLHDLPARVTLPPMPMQERVQLARALAEKHGHHLVDVHDWRPLLRYTQGNPLTITVVAGQALRAGLKKHSQIKAFVEKLRSGEAGFDDDESQGRSRSLGASLRYGFEDAFNEDERKILALLHLFQGFVSEGTLRLMGDPDEEWSLPELRGLTRDSSIALLDRATEVGLLTAHGDGYYSIHPALPWFFKALFDNYYPSSSTTESESPAQTATRAFVEVLRELGNYYHNEYEEGNREVIGALTAEEANLLHARRLARANGWWNAVIGTMQGLNILYDQTGRRAEWKRLVEEIVPDFVDRETDGFLYEREDGWDFVTDYRVDLAMDELKLKEAERLQRIRVEYDRRRATAALGIPVNSLNDGQRLAIRTLAVGLHRLAEIKRKLGQGECTESYEASLQLAKRIGDNTAAATCAYNLGNAHRELPDIRNFDLAGRWYRESLGLHHKHDRLGRGRVLRELGALAIERYIESMTDKAANQVLHHLKEALQRLHEALDFFPADAVYDMSVAHNILGVAYSRMGQLDHALSHYNRSIQYQETMGDLFAAANTRFNVALDLANAGRFEDALLYAQAALGNYETYGQRAAKEIQETKDLMAKIEESQKRQGGNQKP